jgi:hypothetical protein
VDTTSAARLFRRLGGLLAATLTAIAAGAAGGAVPAAPSAARVARDLPLVVVRAEGADRWVALLRASGAAARVGTLPEGVDRGALVVPAGTPLTAEETQRLRLLVLGGGRVVTADPDLLRALGFRLGSAASVKSVHEQGITGLVRWSAPRPVRPLHASPPLRLAPLAWNGSLVVLASARLGKGLVLASAFDPFADGSTGWEALPLLGRETATLTGAPPGPLRAAAEIYLDPGTLSGTPEQLAEHLAGARTVLVAGWNSGFLDPSFDYPYDRLIRALHERGVRVYAWLEPPLVNLGMWTQHPECREKDSSGQDAVDDWRRLIALEDPGCFELAWNEWSRLLTQHDFDGVDVAELYYRSPAVPYHPSALAQFGLDPATHQTQWLRFRRDLVTRLNREIVDRIRSLGKPLDIELTVIDSQLDPELGLRVGSDVLQLAEVARSTGASLQVEDPYTTWTRGPSRYEALTKNVKALMPGRRVFFDINVVPREYDHPTSTMTGAELDLSIANAGRASGRVALYAAGTMLAGDLEHVDGALAGSAVTDDGRVSAPWSVTVASPQAGFRRLLVDGKHWPSARGRATIPAGRHSIAWQPGTDSTPALLDLAGELSSLRASSNSLSFAYSSLGTAWAIVDREPGSLAIDGSAADVETLADPAGGYALRLPSGRHEVRAAFRTPS